MKVAPILLLKHLTCQEVRTVVVSSSTKAWKLFVKWDAPAGVYVVDLKRDRLRRSERGMILPWQCADLDAAKELWKLMEQPEKVTVHSKIIW